MTSTPDPLTGRLLADRYRLTERIDRGGTSEVWRARDTRLERDVAVKILGAEADPAFRDRFTNEARRAASVSHPNIVTVFDEGQDDDDAFIVMEDVRGRSLRDMIAERGVIPAGQTDRIVTQIAAALDATHRAGLVHCDVKPANVIVDGDGNAKLTDFGIARAARDSEERELVGTARYIAPERIEGRPATPRSDVYGLALVAFELLTGKPAFAGAENEDLLRDRLASGAPHVRSVDPTVAERTDVVIAKGLAREPDRRYASAGAFARGLSDALADPVTKVFRPIAIPSWSVQQGRLPRFDSIVALGVVLLLLLGVVLFFAKFPASAGTSPTAAPPASVVGGTAPRVIGLRLDEALKVITAAGYQASWNFDASLQGPPCTVQRQDPAAGSSLARNAYVALGYVPGKDCVKKGD